jgi:hypothetical protein
VIVLDEVIVNSQISQCALTVGLTEEASLITEHGGLDQQRSTKTGLY